MSDNDSKRDMTMVEDVDTKGGIVHVEAADQGTNAWADIKKDADRSEELEHSLSLWQSLRMYRTAVLWAAGASLCIVMEGYDTALLGSFWGLTAFREHYGTYLPAQDQYQVPASWQIGIGQAPVVGNFIGIFWGSWLCDRFGYRKSIMLNLFLMIPFIAMVTFAPSKIVLLFGEFLCGIPWGVFSTLAEAYSSEVCPMSLRGYLTTYINLCWCIGQFVAAGVVVGIQGIKGQWAYRLPFAIQWVWPVPLMVVMYCAPESPWWLVRHGRIEEAEKSVGRLATTDMKDHAKDTVAMMVRTNQLEIDMSVGSSSYLDCFRGTDLRRTEISCMSWACQQLCGLPFAGWASYFFQQAGISEKWSYNLGLINTAGAFCGTIASWFLITRFGRRPIMLNGMAVLCGGQALIGILAIVARKGHVGAQWAQAAVMLTWVFCYDFTVGPLAYCIVGEASSTRLRNKTIGLSRNLYNVLNVVFGIITPYQLNPGEWEWKGLTGFFWAGISLCATVWVFFRLPEFKNRSYYELDILFERRISARKFRETVVEANADDHAREAMGKASH